MEGLTIQEFIENGILRFKYFNEKELEIGDFIDSMNKDLLKVISKNYGFLDKDSPADIKITYFGKNDGEMFIYYWEDDEIDFDKGLILFDEISELLIDNANDSYERRQKQKYFMNIYNDEDDDDDDYYANSMNDFIIDSIKITLCKDAHKVLHKKKFYNDLHNDLMAVAWHPSRYLDWCIDFEELRDLKERWGEED